MIPTTHLLTTGESLCAQDSSKSIPNFEKFGEVATTVLLNSFPFERTLGLQFDDSNLVRFLVSAIHAI